MRDGVFRLALPALAAVLALATPARAQPSPAPAPAASTADVARQFYDAFVRGDHATMEGLYAPDVKFKDTIFAFGDRAGTMGMWRTIINPGPEARFSYELIAVNGNTAVVRWIADYALLGNPIHNEITARLRVERGRIVDHADAFPWDKWARQAFPFLGDFVTWRPVESLLKGSLNLFLRARMTWTRWFGSERKAPSSDERDKDGRAAREVSKTAGLQGALEQRVQQQRGPRR